MAIYSPTLETTEDPIADAQTVDNTSIYTELNPEETTSVEMNAVVDGSHSTHTELNPEEQASVELDAIVDRSYSEHRGLHVPEEPLQFGIRIPTGDFRRVEVTVQDKLGEPLREAMWVQSAGLFPTAGRVFEQEDGSMIANVWLLHTDYEALAVLASNTRTGAFDYVWYDAVEGTALPQEADSVTVQFTKAEAPPPGAPPSLSAGTGISFG